MCNASKDFLEKKKQERIGSENYNKNGELMKVVDYIDSHNVIVEFQDEFKGRKSTLWKSFIDGKVRNPHDYERFGIQKTNNQGCLMKIVEYNNANDIVVEFQDEYKSRIHSVWNNFKNGTIRNPYNPELYGIGIVGNKYLTTCNGKLTKEYVTWRTMLRRCYDPKYKKDLPTYENVICCDEWLLFENFYEWLHSQENFEKWKTLPKSAIDKDILIKGNRIYSPDTCCLVPLNVNALFIKRDSKRGKLPIGVIFYKPLNKYRAQCDDNTGKVRYITMCDTIHDAFEAYKKYKENLIKQIAQEEYGNGNITKQCYDAMMNYQVEITD